MTKCRAAGFPQQQGVDDSDLFYNGSMPHQAEIVVVDVGDIAAASYIHSCFVFA